MSLDKRQYIRDRLHGIYVEKRRAVSSEKSPEIKSLTAEEKVKLIKSGDFEFLPQAEILRNIRRTSNPNISDIFSFKSDKDIVALKDKQIEERNKRLEKLEVEYRRLMDTVYLGTLSETQVIINEFEKFKV